MKIVKDDSEQLGTPGKLPFTLEDVDGYEFEKFHPITISLTAQIVQCLTGVLNEFMAEYAEDMSELERNEIEELRELIKSGLTKSKDPE